MKKIKDLILDKVETSLYKFCAEVKISRTTIYNILNDKNSPSLPTVKKICRYFNVDFRDYI